MHSHPAIVQYAHAVRDPYDKTIAKPFELREVEAEVNSWHEDGEWHSFVRIGDREFPTGWHTDRPEAEKTAVSQAEYILMDESRTAWVKANAAQSGVSV